MEPGNTVMVRVSGRMYLGRINKIERKVEVTILTLVPRIDNSRRKTRNFSKSEFENYGKGGVNYRLLVEAKRG